MSSDEDDYMSDKFLEALTKNDTRPGLLAKKNSHIGSVKTQQKQKQQPSQPISKKKLEVLNREKGLETSISSDNKGFAMLQKMGYKPGMGIGKQEKGRVEPVPIQVKADRGGLGKDAQKRQRVKDLEVWRAKRKKDDETRTTSFLSRMSDKFSNKTTERDLRTAQKACIQLDQQQGLSEPGEPFFWPPSRLPDEGEGLDDDEAEVVPGNLDDRLAGVPDDDVEEEEEEPYNDDDDVEFSDAEKLEMVTRYLRNFYRYCIWCGTAFDSAEDLQASCPGNSAADHD